MKDLITASVLTLNSALELENELCRYNCKTVEDLKEFLWQNYKIVVKLWTEQ